MTRCKRLTSAGQHRTIPTLVTSDFFFSLIIRLDIFNQSIDQSIHYQPTIIVLYLMKIIILL